MMLDAPAESAEATLMSERRSYRVAWKYQTESTAFIKTLPIGQICPRDMKWLLEE